VLLVGLAAGFVYSGIASMRLYAGLFARPASTGAAASIDEQVASLKLSAAEIRAAVQRAAWPADADVSLTVGQRDGGGALNATQLHYALSYLLYPKRIWLTSAPPATRHGIVIGSPDHVSHTEIVRVSDLMMLVKLK